MEDRRDPNRTRRERWWRSVFIVLATIYVALLLIEHLLGILGGFSQIALTLFVSWLLAFILSPVVAGLRRRLRMGRGVAIGLVYSATLLVGGAFLFYAAASIGANIIAIGEDFPQTRVRILITLGRWDEALSFGRFQPNLARLYEDVEATIVRTIGASVQEVPEVTVGLLGGLVLVIVLSLYMLADSERILSRLKRVVPSRWREEADILERNVAQAFGGFLRAQVVLAAVQTVLTIAVIVLVGLPYGFFIAAASALAMLIPFFGPPLALVPPIVAVAIFEPGMLLVVAPVLLVVQTVLVNYIQPRLMREALGMHPLLVLVGLLVGAQVAGLFGALFGIPVLAVLNTFFNYFVNLRTIEESATEERDEVIEELRQLQPDAAQEDLVAMAAEQVEDGEEAAAAAAAGEDAVGGEVDEELRAAATDLRQAAGDQRDAAGRIGESVGELRDAVGQLRPDDPEAEPERPG